ncbi:solute carrier family 23 protein [Nocardiopsis potens]|uniref:solute carrier family 23 protein n=1 Tax=Nocardiopsis potens TaxID=1246458 RepID=UPI000349246E|nr:solute carrier family 23 protein [Nocardiopsis potens]
MPVPRLRRPRAAAAPGPVDQRLPLGRSATLGLQHVLVMYAGVVAVPLILAETLGLDRSQTVALVNANLIVGGVGTLVQALGLWRFGARFPIVQGASFIGLAPALLIGERYGLPSVFGAVIAAGALTVVLAPVFSRLLRFFPPVVIGSLVTIVGISLMPAAAGWLGGGEGSEDFGAPVHLLLGLLTVATTIAVHVLGRGLWSSLSVLAGLAVGTCAAFLTGTTDFGGVSEAPWVGLAAPLSFGAPRFEVVPVLMMSLAMLVILAETTGNMLAIGHIVGVRVDRRRLADAFRADGLASMLGGLYNGFPLNAFSQNTGLLAMTRVRSRFTVAAGGLIMIAFGLLPKIGAVVSAIPPAVLGGGAIVMFGMTTAAGVQELARVRYAGTNNALVVAVSLSVGVLPMASPELFGRVHGPLGLVLESGIFLGAITAVLLNALLHRPAREEERGGPESSAPEPPADGGRDDERNHMADTAAPTAGTPTDQDIELLRRAFALAREAAGRGRHPFGALVAAADGTVIAARGNNSMPPEGDPTRHAELCAAAAAAQAVPLERLAGATLYSSAEPCAMCTGALYWTGIGRLVYGLSERRLLEFTGDAAENPTLDLPCREVLARGQRRVEVIGPLLEDEAALPHRGFWR